MSTKQVLILDSSQISAFGECPELWNLQYRQQLAPAARGENVPMDMGTYGHKLLEIIYKERSKGNVANALKVAFDYDVDKETCRCSHGAERHSPENWTGLEVEHLACQSIGCDCSEFVPVEFPLSKPDRQFVRDRVMEYTFCEGTAIPLLVPKGPDYVESGFSKKIFEDDKRLWILEGRIDLIGQIAPNYENGWADHKFQARERDLYLKSIQFRNYSYVTQLPIGVVNYIRFAKKVEPGKTFKRAIISFSRLEMQAWEDELLSYFHRVELFLQRQERGEYEKGDREWSACSGKYGYPCDFTKICENWMIPDLINLTKKTDYKVKPEWRPW